MTSRKMVCVSVLASIFQVDLLASTKMSPFWILLDLMMMEVVVTPGAIRRAKLQSIRDHQQTITQLFSLDTLHVAQ